MISASVTDDGWLAGVPADRPVLVIAEGLVPYLTEPEARTLLRRLTDHFRSGELLFDGLARWAVRISKPLKWSPRDGAEIESWQLGLSCAEAVPITTHHRLIPSRGYRAIYRFMELVPALRNSSVDYRFTF